LDRYSAYTCQIPGNHRYAVVIDVQIGIPFQEFRQTKKLFVPTRALVDTGASTSAISKTFSQQTNLKSFKMTKVFTANGVSEVLVYCLDVFLPNNLLLENWSVMEFSGGKDFDFIIGMDILRMGDIAITNANDAMVFSFRIPPDIRHIDFMKKERTEHS
jgi:predicted aspartyl protease